MCVRIFLFLLFSVTNVWCGAFFISSVPKSGTHLVQKLFELTGRKRVDNSHDYLILVQNQLYFGNNKFLFTHCISSHENQKLIEVNGMKGVFIYRDPRDQVVSFTYHILKSKDWFRLKKFSKNQLLSLLITQMSVIYGGKGWKNDLLKELRGIDSFYALYMGWLNHPNVYTTTFEKLVGSKGGGSDELQLQEIINIAHHIGVELSIAQSQKIADDLFGGTTTFREGQIGSWKKEFTQEHKTLFKEVAGQLLIDLGYEKDFDW